MHFGETNNCAVLQLSTSLPHRKPHDERVEEQVVQNSDREPCVQAGGHQRARVVDVAAEEVRGYADADGLRRGGDEREGVDELLRH